MTYKARRLAAMRSGVVLAAMAGWLGAHGLEAAAESPREAVPVAAAGESGATNVVASQEADVPADAGSGATNAPAPVQFEPGMSQEESRRSFLQIQGQLDHALLAIERSRRESEAVVQRTKEEVSTRLKTIERNLQDQRDRETQAIRESNQNMLIIAGVLAGMGFLTMLMASFFHLRAMNRMASLATQLPYGPGLLGAGGGGVSGLEERLIGPANGAGPGRLLGAIERLEKRVFELEHTTQMPAQEIGGAGDGGDWDRGAGAAAEASLQLGRSQAMMNLGQYEEALTCLNQFLEHRPEHAEGLIKKGSILEKLNRAEEAIACYDQAIALNGSLTLAYLYKGGLFNRLERFDEALACYEQALKTQGKPVS